MSEQITYKIGEPQRFVVARNFTLGNLGGKKLTAGDELLFDGTHITFDGHQAISLPEFRGVIKQGWVKLASQYDANDQSASIPRSAGIQIRDAQGGNPMEPKSRTPITTVDAEEREVGNVGAHARATQNRNATRPGQRVAVTSVEPQEGIPVRELRTPAKQDANLETETVGQIISRAENQSKIQAGKSANIREVKVPEDNPEAEREREMNRKIIASRIAAPKDRETEGFHVHNAVGGGIETADLSGMDGKVEESVVEVEGMRFSNTNVGKPKPKPIVSTGAPISADHRVRLARAICPDFPNNYNFDDPARKKIARIQADFDDRPDVIRAVVAAEADNDVKVRLMEEFPEAFA